MKCKGGSMLPFFLINFNPQFNGSILALPQVKSLINMKIYALITFFTCGLSFLSQSQNEYLDHPIDILSYQVTVELSPDLDTIYGQETIHFQIAKACDSFFIDLQSINNGKGMRVTSPMTVNIEEVAFRHTDNRIWIKNDPKWQGVLKLHFYYAGIPETGLIIGENKFGDRTFFGDNWPNRAHHWFACVDHPSDKAKVNFTVWAPIGMECIATGALLSTESLKMPRNKFVFNSDIELPTKVMVIGVADFQVKEYPSDLGFPITAWVYPQDGSKGFTDMAIAVEVTEFFVKTIGAYPYEKLANVQSTTQFGGMENAGNIFYDEKAVTGEKTMDALIAHEIAHQWFGNSASELDWKHIWLSEGFATYFTDVYWENAHGTEAMNERLQGERQKVIAFSKRYAHPVVDTTYESLMHLLNPNSYQKGAWILHMLRTKIGDEAFFNGFRTYYKTYEYSNAETADFQKIMEESAGISLDSFFQQWLYTSGHPMLQITPTKKRKSKSITIRQEQKGTTFQFDLEVEIGYKDGSSETVNIPINEKEVIYALPSNKKISGFVYDPNTKLLFEEVEH